MGNFDRRCLAALPVHAAVLAASGAAAVVGGVADVVPAHEDCHGPGQAVLRGLPASGTECVTDMYPTCSLDT